MSNCERRNDSRPGLRLVRAGLLLTGVALALTARAPAQRFEKDPVEEFRQALILEYNKEPRYKDRLAKEGRGEALVKAVAFRKKNLEEKAARLQSLDDVARALLLIEWPQVLNPESKFDDFTPAFDKQSRAVEKRIREDLARKFRRGVAGILQDPDTRPAARVAVANLLGETIAQAEQSDLRLQLYKDLSSLAEVLSRQAGDPAPTVRVAIARALSQFPTQPKLVTPGLRKQLEGRFDEKTRQAAADALYQLSLSISNTKPIRSSVPGIANREPTVSGKLLTFPEEIVSVVEAVTDTAAVGLSDPSAAVRRQCMSAIRHVAGGLAYELRLSQSPASELGLLPPRERPERSAEERRRLREARANQEQELKIFVPCLNRYTKYAGLLKNALFDADAGVRLEAGRTFQELARARNTIRELRESVPEDDEPDLTRRTPLRKTPHNAPRGNPAGTELVPVSARLRQDRTARADPITGMLDETARDLVRDGLADPDARTRRAAHEAIEALGDGAIPYIPTLTRSLADRDVFVRWITARTFRKIAEEDERLGRKPRHAEAVIRGLIKGLDDEDLDAAIAMTRALGAYGPVADPAVPALGAHLGKGDAIFQTAVIKALEGIGHASKGALPALARALGDPDARIRAEAARLIGRLAKDASAYLPDLEKLADDPDPKVRENASAAILAVRPAR